MGWTVLYIAFGVVALWLLGEVLLQYKARLRWRLIAFCGFLGVVLGVLMPSVPVIVLGAVAFATGQTFVTLSFRRGFSTGWAIGGRPGTSRRRRAERAAAPADDNGPPPPADTPAEGVPAVVPQAHDGAHAEDGAAGDPPGYPDQPYPDQPYPDDTYAAAAPGYGGEGGFPGGPEPSGYGEQPAYGDGYGGQPYEDPFGASPAYAGAGDAYRADDGYPGYGDTPYGEPSYGDPGYAAEPAYGAAGSYDTGSGSWAAAGAYQPETPPGGVWLPPQREGAPDAADAGYGPHAPAPDAPGWGPAPGAPDPGYYYGNGPGQT
jgi:hypothetical protein